MPSSASHNIDDYESLLVALQNVLGVVVPEVQRSHLVQRIEPLLLTFKLDSLAALAESLQDNREQDIKSSVLDVISEYQASWTLNAASLKLLHDYVISQLPENARIWVVGCGQGQLAYGVDMELADYEHKSGDSKRFKLFATDSSLSNIKRAELATYHTWQLSGLSDQHRHLYTTVTNTADDRQIKEKISQNINFSQCDLTEDFQSMGAMDLIICPEVLVYYSNGVRAGIIKQFSERLNAGGILLTGTYQAVPVNLGLERVEHPAGVFYRKKG